MSHTLPALIFFLKKAKMNRKDKIEFNFFVYNKCRSIFRWTVMRIFFQFGNVLSRLKQRKNILESHVTYFASFILFENFKWVSPGHFSVWQCLHTSAAEKEYSGKSCHIY